MKRAWIAALLIIAACGGEPPPPPAPVSLDKAASDFNLMAADFLRDFDEGKYVGKVVEVTGIYSDWTLVGDPKHATDITLLAPGWPDKLFFALDREVMDKRMLILDYVAADYPTGVKVEATELTEAFWPPDKDVTEARKFAGRVIEVSGTVESVEGSGVVLRSIDETRPVRCRLLESDPSIAVGQTIVLKGVCMGHVAGTTGVTVTACVRR